MCFIIDTSSEEEFVGCTRSCSITELQGPQAINRDGIACPATELAEEGTVVRIDGIDATVTEIADQQVITESAKISGGESQAPGRVEPAVRNEASDQITVGVEDVDKPMSRTRYVVVMLRIL